MALSDILKLNSNLKCSYLTMMMTMKLINVEQMFTFFVLYAIHLIEDGWGGGCFMKHCLK